MSGKKVIFIVFVMLSACSTIKKNVTTETFKPVRNISLLPEKILSMNVTEQDFNIQRAEIEISNNGESQRLIASLKFRNPGTWLVAVKNRAGIEAARIYITKDTVMVNDRIYKKLYVGSNDFLLKKYGITTDAIPLIFGDYLDDLTEMETVKDCKEGFAEWQGYRDKKELWYTLDCSRAKVAGLTISDKAGTAGINMKYDDFRKTGNILFPGKIIIEDIMQNTHIDIIIGNLELVSGNKIEFIPGRNYEKIILK